MTESNTRLNKKASKSKWVDSKFNGELSGSTFDADGLKISIGHNKFCDVDIWFLNCDGLKIESKALVSRDLKWAREQALEIVSLALRAAMEAIADELKLS